MKSLIIIGASGHGKVVADIAKLNGYEEIRFLDDREDITECGGFPVIGRSSQFEEHDCDIFVAIGNAIIRKKLIDIIEEKGKKIVTLIHPNAVIANKVNIKKILFKLLIY
mgnify:CR=1 FL=1